MVDALTPRELAAWLRRQSRDLLLVDVREPEERAEAALHPSAHVPVGELERRLGELPRDRLLVLYCHHGIRSAMCAAFLESQGFRVAHLSGGIDAWFRTFGRGPSRAADGGGEAFQGEEDGRSSDEG